MVAIWPYLKQFARNKMIWQFFLAFFNIEEKAVLEKSEQNFIYDKYFMKFLL